MQCFHPMYLRDRFGFVKKVPCGHCLACRQNHARMWALRLRFEMTQWSCGTFLTLTYDDEHLPSDGRLNYPDVQLFLKRLRKDIEPLKVKFFAVGEYGETFGRPHYHLIIFGLDFDYDYQARWSFGFVKAGSVTSASIGYVSGYCTKSDRFGKPFIRCSQGLGLEYFKGKVDEVLSFGLKVDGSYRQVPRYFVSKLPEELKHKYVCRARLVAQKAFDVKYRRLSQDEKNWIDLAGDSAEEMTAESKEVLYLNEEKRF